MSELNIAAALPEVFLACAGMILLMLGVFRGNSGTRLVLSLTVACFILAMPNRYLPILQEGKIEGLTKKLGLD